MWIYSYKNWWYSESYNSFFFDNYKIKGSKYLNFLDFKSAALIIKNKEHLKQDRIGLNKILLLKKNIADTNE